MVYDLQHTVARRIPGARFTFATSAFLFQWFWCDQSMLTVTPTDARLPQYLGILSGAEQEHSWQQKSHLQNSLETNSNAVLPHTTPTECWESPSDADLSFSALCDRCPLPVLLTKLRSRQSHQLYQLLNLERTSLLGFAYIFLCSGEQMCLWGVAVSADLIRPLKFGSTISENSLISRLLAQPSQITENFKP